MNDRWKPQHFDTGRSDYGNAKTTLIPSDDWYPGERYIEQLPLNWDGAHVADRLKLAFETLGRMPGLGMSSGMRGFWPQIVSELTEEEIAEIEAELAKQPTETRVPPTATEISRTEAALCWASTYLTGDECRIVQAVAFYRAIGKEEMAYAAQQLLRKLKPGNRTPKEIADFQQKVVRYNETALDRIAAGLRRDLVPVF